MTTKQAWGWVQKLAPYVVTVIVTVATASFTLGSSVADASGRVASVESSIAVHEALPGHPVMVKAVNALDKRVTLVEHDSDRVQRTVEAFRAQLRELDRVVGRLETLTRRLDRVGGNP